MSQTSSPQALAPWLALWRTPGIGPIKFAALVDAFSSVTNVLSADSQTLAQFGLRNESISALKNPDWGAVENDLAWIGEQHHIISWDDARYPDMLREIAAHPPILYVMGDINTLSQPQLAIVGSRNPTHHGTETATHFAKFLSNYSFTITSGLALGIDAASHQGALAGKSPTIAVAGTGLDRIYPGKNQDLAANIAENGAIVSEFPLGTTVTARNFPRRNRIISGLSMGVLVVEAALRSGSLITAHYALEQSREVFAIPGSIHNPLSKGCHALIRQGAKLVETVEDITSELGDLSGLLHDFKPKMSEKNLNTLAKDQQKLVKCLGFEASAVDVLVQRSGFSAGKVASLLLTLELQGYVKSITGGYIKV